MSFSFMPRWTARPSTAAWLARMYSFVHPVLSTQANASGSRLPSPAFVRACPIHTLSALKSFPGLFAAVRELPLGEDFLVCKDGAADCCMPEGGSGGLGRCGLEAGEPLVGGP